MDLIARYTRWLHTQWPHGKVEKMPAVGEGGSTNIEGVRVVGDLTGVPLLKFSADTGAKAIQAFLDEGLQAGAAGDFDVVIVGAGVSGHSAAIEAKKAGLSYVLYESQEAFSTIENFPRKKPIYTYPTDMVPAGEMRFEAEVKEDLLKELHHQVAEYAVQPENAAVDFIERKGGLLHIHFARGKETVTAQRVVIAIGRTGNFRKLNVPGENLDKVTNRLIGADEFAGQNVLVVGGGDSALEAAISLADAGAKVILSYRRKEFQRPKPDNIARIEELRAADKLDLRLGTQVQEIKEDAVTLCDEDGCDTDIPNDQVFTLIGREPPLDFFRKSKVNIVGEWSKWSVLGLIGFFGLMIFLYHLKAYVPFLGIPGTNLWQIFASHGWFPFSLDVVGQAGSLIHTITSGAANDPGFLFAFLYSAVIVTFGSLRIRRRKTPYVTRQTLVLMAFQVIPLFLLPFIVFPWMGANGWFTSGGFGEWFGTTFLSNGPGTEPDQYWRAFGFILAWPLFIYNIFTDAPLWGWLIVGFVQTFVIIPLIIFRWGKGAYCGWICSCGAMAETLGDQQRHKMPHGQAWNRVNMVGQAILLICFVLLAMRIAGWIFPGEYRTNEQGQYLNEAGQVVDSAAQAAWDPSLVASWFSGLKDGNSVFSYKYLIDLWLAGAIGYGLYFHYSGRVWCRFACPLAALMHVYTRFSRFRIFADKDKCISCNACTSVCHQGIDVMNFANKGKHMQDPECVRCSACVQTCPTGVLNFGHYTSDGGIQLDRLGASRVQLAEAEAANTPFSEYLAATEKKLAKKK